MRIVPRKWSSETWLCSMRGHVSPAATVRILRASDQTLGLSLADDTRLSRCLRCDTWLHTDPPDEEAITSTYLPAFDGLPRPLRGKALDERIVVRLIAIERGLHVVFFLLLAAGLIAVQIGLPWIRSTAAQILEGFQAAVSESRPATGVLSHILSDLTQLDRGHLLILTGVFIGYAILEGVEAVFLWKGKRWAEYLTVLATVALLPLVVQSLLERVTAGRIGALLIDLAVVAYLIIAKRLFGVRGGTAAHEAAISADMNWEQLYSRAPIVPIRYVSHRE